MSLSSRPISVSNTLFLLSKGEYPPTFIACEWVGREIDKKRLAKTKWYKENDVKTASTY